MENAHALVIGIAHYHNVRQLPQTVLNDAKQIHATLIDEGFGAYTPDNVHLLRDDEATKGAIQSALTILATTTNHDSTVFIYFSGHGGRIETGPFVGEYLVPVDAVIDSDETLACSCIASAELTEALRVISARRLVVIFDCCHAGGIGEPKDLNGAEFKMLPESYFETLKSGRGRVILSSSRSDELSWILNGAENSLFTQHLLAGLRGNANGAGGVIRIFDLFNYVQPRVTQDKPIQHPIFKAELEENFAIALFKGGTKAVTTVRPPQDHYEFDAFISYSESKTDRRWVRNFIQSLQTANFKIAVDYLAPLGMPKITFAEEAVTKSRYTLVILSPAYLASRFAEFQSLIAQHLGQEQSQYRVVPLMIEECTPRLGLRILPILDMTDSAEFEFNFDRLLDYLSQQPALRQ